MAAGSREGFVAAEGFRIGYMEVQPIGHHDVLALAFAKQHQRSSCCAMKRSKAATNRRLIGLISADEASGSPRCTRKKLAAPSGRWATSGRSPRPSVCRDR